MPYQDYHLQKLEDYNFQQMEVVIPVACPSFMFCRLQIVENDSPGANSGTFRPLRNQVLGTRLIDKQLH